MHICWYLILWTTHLPMLHLKIFTIRCLFLVGHFCVAVSIILVVMVKTIAHHRPELRYRCWTYIPRNPLKSQVLAAPSLFWWFIARKNMIMSLVQMGSRGGQGGDVVGVQILALIIGLPLIVNSSRGASVTMGRRLGREIIGSSGSKTSMIAG